MRKYNNTSELKRERERQVGIASGSIFEAFRSLLAAASVTNRRSHRSMKNNVAMKMQKATLADRSSFYITRLSLTGGGTIGSSLDYSLGFF